MHSRRLHGAEIHSTRVSFCIINQSDYDPGGDRTRDQWYRNCMPYHKATAAVVLARKLGTFILYIFIPRSVNEQLSQVQVPLGGREIGQGAPILRILLPTYFKPCLALHCIHVMSCHVIFIYMGIWRRNAWYLNAQLWLASSLVVTN